MKVVLGNRKLISNISPTVVIGSMILLIVFSRIKVNRRIISLISSLTFGIYLFQNNKVIWNLLENSMVWLLNVNNQLSFILYILGCALLLFVLGLIVELVRRYLEKLLKIKKISQAIIDKTERLINRLNN